MKNTKALKMSKKKLTLVEKIAKFLNEREVLGDVEIGIVGQDLAIIHNKETEEEAAEKRKVVMKEFVKIGLGYKVVLANFNGKVPFTIFKPNYKGGEEVFKVNMEYLEAREKRKSMRPERFAFQSEAQSKTE